MRSCCSYVRQGYEPGKFLHKKPINTFQAYYGPRRVTRGSGRRAAHFGDTDGETGPYTPWEGSRQEEEKVRYKNSEVDAYIEACGLSHREALTTLRDLAHEARPDVVEMMRYKMPTFEHADGGFLCAMASRKNGVSLYCGPDALDEHRGKLGQLDVGKGCIRFKKVEDLPLDAIRRILERSEGS